MEFGQLTEYNMRNNFLEKYTENVVGKLFPDSFLKIQIWVSISSLKFYTVCFYSIPSWGLPKDIKIKLPTTWSYLI